ncbi:class III extradiol ring-cleavage dioxygenase family protein [Mycobacterium camsae]|uniref:hypothetical protein n=1 Tax=Mycobacterium gordonae TaxID=1778 RepID=UPI00197EAEF1|nr:hypothetical protein [Mycobacterium gordonae]
MLSAVAIVPCAPVLVPELAGAAGAEVADLAGAVVAAAAVLPRRWVAVGIDRVDAVVTRDSVGTFAGFGVDVPVRLSPEPGVVRGMPLCALMAAWVRGRARPDGSAEVRVYAADADPVMAVAHGRRLRADIDAQTDPTGVLIVADGANTLTARAPGGYDPGGAGAQQLLDDALAAGDVAALSRLPRRILGRVAFGVLAGLVEPGPRSAKELYRGAPYGVGYFAGVWQP